MALMNSLVFTKLLNQIRPRVGTATNTNINVSPRQVSINTPRTSQFSGSNINSNTYGRSNENIFKNLALKKGGSVIAKGNKLTKSKPTKLY
jgi:hypothetical protein